MKSFTDLEQSKKLEKILPLESADMCWTNHCYGVMRSSMTISAKTVDEYKSLLDRFNDSASIDVFYPAWSLAALLDILPKGKVLIDDIHSNKYKVIGYNLDTDYYDEPLDAVFEMILKLKENNKL